MAVINTKEWLENDFAEPLKIVAKCKELFSESNPKPLYKYLQSHGMYSPSSRAKKGLENLIERDIWGATEGIYHKYKELWAGSEIPVYIFPFRESNGLSRTKSNKSGLAFKDKLFLFVHSSISDKELEAVFVHEYHHVCRLNRLKKNPEQYTLLDSMIMEGLAEYAVLKHVGKQYLAKWTSLYDEKELLKYYDRYLKTQLQTKRTEELHDELLLGAKPFPSMLGYCTGYYLVSKAGLVPVKKSFTIFSEEILKKADFKE
ncbi:hypothetical protein ELQ35_06665 [Peribacillus cavernae]|uniref:DUF2268 domain-containing protein n=1 Tax=Peribacillus cavernae TaxID=1674310 RepID=A0A433HP84_9BACI|nr:DUF2268 domain-containing putative Zn-dependent protease [Peribacillus cavernae]MDQ0217532.1 uncharacterized protein YjaZ [Peribacillus cavernae]RUQ30032.1 hypothetical protein ELQ35_06665 [Peribacillus cavernae]